MATAVLCVLASGSWALGLGQIRVQSALGEALRAEIEVIALTPEEAATLQARVATAEAYRAAGLEFNPVLPGTRVTLERRPDGRAVLRLTGERAVQEPFVDVMLELSWATGRLVRQYTVLLDPPRLQAAPLPAPPAVAAVPAPPAVAVTPAPPAPPMAAVPPRPAVTAAPRPAEPPAPRPPAPVAAAPAAAPVEGQITVRRGDTLGEIAQRTQPPAVSLEQMLVSLFQANPHAFIHGNMNLLRSGAVLTVPAAADAAQVPRDEALRVIRAQSTDFNAFRQRLAGVAPRVGADEPAQRAAGQVQARVDERAPAAVAADQLRLSQGAVQPDAPEARLAREAEQRDAAARVAELRRNVEELERLQQAARSATAPTPGTTPAAAPPAGPAPAVAPAEAQPAAPAELALTGPAVTATPPVAAPPAAVTAVAPPAASPATLPAAATPGFMVTMLDNPLVLPGAGALIALLAGLGIYRLRRRSPIESGETSFLESRGAQDSFFGATGGARVDTRQSSNADAPASSAYGLSQLDAIGDVDPVAEADVYLAYGRDLQAEEILKEAMRANPERLAIRSKLLEVYAKRRDAKGFESLATQLYGLTQGQGDDWLKAQDLGRQIDPDNLLYRPGGEPAASAGDAARAAAALGATTMPASVLPLSADAPSRQPIEPLPSMDVDLDLNLDAPAELVRASAPVPLTEATQPLTRAEDPDEAAPAAVAPDSRLERGLESRLDFELPFEDTAPPSPPAVAAAPAPAPAGASAFDFGDLSLDLDLPAAKPAAAASVAAEMAPPMLDFGSLEGLDLPGADGSAEAARALDDGDDERTDPLQRKLELAEEFRQIGDLEGARDLLEEVAAQGGDALKSRARAMLDRMA